MEAGGRSVVRAATWVIIDKWSLVTLIWSLCQIILSLLILNKYLCTSQNKYPDTISWSLVEMMWSLVQNAIAWSLVTCTCMRWWEPHIMEVALVLAATSSIKLMSASRSSGGNCIKICLSGKLIFSKRKRSWGSPILLKIVSENQFSGKTYFYTIHPWRQEDGCASVHESVQGRGEASEVEEAGCLGWVAV